MKGDKFGNQYSEIMGGYRAFLLEASVKELRDRWVMGAGERGMERMDDERRLPDSVFDELVAVDPTENKKYLPWMLKRYVEERGPHTMNRIKDAIRTFGVLVDRNQLRGAETDIFQYKTIEKLEDVVKHYVDPDTGEVMKTKSEIRKEKSGLKDVEDVDPADLVFDGPKAFVVRPTTKNASIKYGRGTHWCTSADGSRNLYNDYYLNRGYTLYYIIAKVPMDVAKAFKIAAAVPARGSGSASAEYFFADDSSMRKDTFNKYMKRLGVPLD